ncbi:hypothetical protein MUS1_12620 [Marinomonas ushuaiensis DSM 15871]|uniref:Uncharacterized protein n=1 Tax=Marinomonas ushuaiensis DSM 15871 TaxID=1122207 RepID=X7E419_9GAMM|nr:hypothetical protein [Marinomonas ushuaiensis]ETX10814.1 hypothetical protein MUS1_12620 [Marinomonas ushuaiensis DSM 15871]
MFGLKRMHKRRKLLYERTQNLEKCAKKSREKAIGAVLDKAITPTGLITSFVLGASTQLDVTKKVKKNLLDGASRDVLSFLSTQMMSYVMTPDSQVALEEGQPSVDQHSRQTTENAK